MTENETSNKSDLGIGMIAPSEGTIVIKAFVATSDDALTWLIKNKVLFEDRMRNSTFHSQPTKYHVPHDDDDHSECQTVDCIYVQLTGELILE